MEATPPSKDRVLELGKLNAEDLLRIRQCRRDYNRLGFGYQIAFVRLENRFPVQTPFELIDDLLTFVAVQTDIETGEIDRYVERQQPISDHQIQIREYLTLTPFEEADRESKRFGSFDHFFVETSRWQAHQADFFRQACLPASPAEAIDYLTNRLSQAYDDFLHSQPDNAYPKKLNAPLLPMSCVQSALLVRR